MTLLSFHGDPAIKEKYMKRVRAHAQADELIQGQYWQNGKGCAVGCTIHGSDHAAYETELGLPEWLARLEDTLFEGLTNADAKQFAVDFLEAIPVGVALDRVKGQFHVFLLQENLDRVQSLPLPSDLKQQILAAMQQVLTLHEQSLASGVSVTESAVWRAAESAAWSAESAAESAAKSAAESARGAKSAAESARGAKSAIESAIESAVWSARSAAESAESAAWSAESAAWSAESAAESAESAAKSAASAAESVAMSAVWSAAASAAASAVWSVAMSAVWSAAASAWSARSAARSAAYKRYVDQLLSLLREAR